MADTVSSRTLFDGTHKHVLHLTNLSDGTGESAVTKLDISTLTMSDGTVPTAVTVQEVRWALYGFSSILLAWDHTANDTIVRCSGNDYISFLSSGGMKDPRSAGGTGDIILSTQGAVADAAYDITLVLILEA